MFLRQKRVLLLLFFVGGKTQSFLQPGTSAGVTEALPAIFLEVGSVGHSTHDDRSFPFTIASRCAKPSYFPRPNFAASSD